MSVRYNIQVKDIGATPIISTMNEDKTITFAYIAGREHAAVIITTEQYNKIKNILYGKAKET